MRWLEAALAFALLLIIFSTIVSTILEMAYRAFGLRHKGLKLMLGHLFDQVIWPRYSGRPVRMGRLNEGWGVGVSPTIFAKNLSTCCAPIRPHY